MADSRAFIGFDFDDDEIWQDVIIGQANRDCPTALMCQSRSSKTAPLQAAWVRLIKANLASTNISVVLVERYTATATGAAKEILAGSNLDVPVFGVYVDGAGVSSPPHAGLNRERALAWIGALAAAEAIQRMMPAGKNA